MHSTVRFGRWRSLEAVALLLLIFGAGGWLRAQDAKESQNRPEGTVIESRDFSVTGSGFVIAKLEDGAKAFSNRGYVWQSVPVSLRGRRYTQSAGGDLPHLVVHAKQSFVLDVMTATEQRGLDLASWNQPGTSFIYTDGKGKTGKGTRVVLLHKTLQKGQDLVLPQGNWTGVLVIFPD
ncbi:MAG TPA: hypothetical protein VK961_18765 [Chthoniobacter sp.]|nr:hypothetical protein [Chthoniobacter sp.]